MRSLQRASLRPGPVRFVSFDTGTRKKGHMSVDTNQYLFCAFGLPPSHPPGPRNRDDTGKSG